MIHITIPITNNGMKKANEAMNSGNTTIKQINSNNRPNIPNNIVFTS